MLRDVELLAEQVHDIRPSRTPGDNSARRYDAAQGRCGDGGDARLLRSLVEHRHLEAVDAVDVSEQPYVPVQRLAVLVPELDEEVEAGDHR